MNSAIMRKAIAIDFDGCLCTDAYPAIGQPNWDVINRAKQEQRDGAGLILWTCREGDLLQEAVCACKRWGLALDAVNESLSVWIEAFGTQPRKVGATEYWDDKAVRMPVQKCTLSPEYLNDGLTWKYIVYKRDTGVRIEHCFVLRPDKDTAAVAALRSYAKATENKTLATDIISWVGFDKEEIEPLTLEDLRDLDGEPVWREQAGHDGRWVLVDCSWRSKGVIYLCNSLGNYELARIALNEGTKFYRHKPEAIQHG